MTMMSHRIQRISPRLRKRGRRAGMGKMNCQLGREATTTPTSTTAVAMLGVQMSMVILVILVILGRKLMGCVGRRRGRACMMMQKTLQP